MPSVKYRPMEPLSAWMIYELASDLLDPPTLRLRLRPIDLYSIVDGVAPDGSIRYGSATVEAVIAAVAEWDLTQEGVPIPCSDLTKAGWLRPLLDQPVRGRKQGELLAVAILHDARNRENFLKN